MSRASPDSGCFVATTACSTCDASNPLSMPCAERSTATTVSGGRLAALHDRLQHPATLEDGIDRVDALEKRRAQRAVDRLRLGHIEQERRLLEVRLDRDRRIEHRRQRVRARIGACTTALSTLRRSKSLPTVASALKNARARAGVERLELGDLHEELGLFEVGLDRRCSRRARRRAHPASHRSALEGGATGRGASRSPNRCSWPRRSTRAAWRRLRAGGRTRSAGWRARSPTRSDGPACSSACRTVAASSPGVFSSSVK